jgi:hypothetical protein
MTMNLPSQFPAKQTIPLEQSLRQAMREIVVALPQAPEAALRRLS